MSELDDKLPIGAEQVAEATAILQKYKAGKAALDKRIVDNELWFRMGHWKNCENKMMEGKPKPSSGSSPTGGYTVCRGGEMGFSIST